MRRRLLRRGPVLFAAFVVLALGGLYWAAGLPHTAAAARANQGQASHADVARVIRACPAPGSGGATAASVAMMAYPGSAVTGQAVVSRLTPGGSAAPGQALATVTRPGLLQVSAVTAAPGLSKEQLAGKPGSSPAVTTQAGRGGVLISATGAMAQGLQVEQTSPAGLATAQCGAPGTDFWFVGPGQIPAGHIELYLMNTDSQAADAQVSMLTDVTKGAPLLANADNGITVPPHSMVVQSLTKLLQSSKVVALNVSTSVGRVVPAVRETRSARNDGAWLAPVSAPATSVVIPGLPRDPGPHDLYIAVPGSATAEVKVTAVTTKGSYQPTGGTGIALLGGSATVIPLSALSNVSGAVKITANVPVVAAMLIPGGARGTPGVVVASAGQVLEQGVLAANPARSAGQTQLALSAPAGEARVQIIEATSTGSTGVAQAVTIKAGSSVVLPIGPPRGGRVTEFAIVVTPDGTGPVYAGQISASGGAIRSVLPMLSSPTVVRFPPVRDSLSVFLR